MSESRAARRPWIVAVSGASGTPYAAAVIRALLDAGEPVDLVVSRAARLTILDETGGRFRDTHWREDLLRWLSVGRPCAADGGGRRAGEAGGPCAGDGGRRRAGDAGGQCAGDGGGRRAGDGGGPCAGDDGGVGLEVGDVVYWPAGDLAAGPSSGSYPARGMIVVPASVAACAGIALGLSKDLLQRAAQVNLKERRPVVVVPRETPVTRSHLLNLVALHDAGAVVLPASPGFYSGGATALAAELIDFVAGRVLDAVGVEHTLYTRWSGRISQTR